MAQPIPDDVIHAAIEGFQAQKQRIEQQIAELRSMLSHDGRTAARAPQPAARRRTISAAGMGPHCGGAAETLGGGKQTIRQHAARSGQTQSSGEESASGRRKARRLKEDREAETGGRHGGQCRPVDPPIAARSEIIGRMNGKHERLAVRLRPLRRGHGATRRARGRKASPRRARSSISKARPPRRRPSSRKRSTAPRPRPPRRTRSAPWRCRTPSTGIARTRASTSRW